VHVYVNVPNKWNLYDIQYEDIYLLGTLYGIHIYIFVHVQVP
jgi:hypothetical protein